MLHFVIKVRILLKIPFSDSNLIAIIQHPDNFILLQLITLWGWASFMRKSDHKLQVVEFFDLAKPAPFTTTTYKPEAPELGAS